jgi:hypothetical protein
VLHPLLFDLSLKSLLRFFPLLVLENLIVVICPFLVDSVVEGLLCPLVHFLGVNLVDVFLMYPCFFLLFLPLQQLFLLSLGVQLLLTEQLVLHLLLILRYDLQLLHLVLEVLGRCWYLNGWGIDAMEP